MSEPRKNHLNIDGGQVKEDDHIASYKPIPEADTEFRTSKSNLSKSKEKVSSDGAEEKLLQKEDEAKIKTRVDMADAKYVVGDHRNGDAKIELDANKRQFSGLTKEELLKYADDPFWVRLRWFMFVLFWAMWLAMLAGAIAIIVQAPKCAPPTPKTWFQKGPLVDLSSMDDYRQIEAELPLMQSSKVQGIFAGVCKDTYAVLDEKPGCLEEFKAFVTKAKQYSIKVIVDLTANFVSKSHRWFVQSENGSAEFGDYFVWRKERGYNGNETLPPNQWVSTLDASAWTLSDRRKQYYLHQYGEEQPDLNFTNPAVVRQFDQVLKLWMQAGADGVRLQKARQLLVNDSFADEHPLVGHGHTPGADHLQYAYWQHRHTSDQPALDSLLAHWSHVVDTSASTPGAGESVFTLAESDGRPELWLLDRNTTCLRPASAAPLDAERDPAAVAADINARLLRWPAMQLTSSPEAGEEVASLALLLPAAPVLALDQLRTHDNDTDMGLGHLVSLRSDASVEHGAHQVLAVPAANTTRQLLACARWKAGHTGYVAVFNPAEEEARADLTPLPSVPEGLTVHHVSHAVKIYTNYTNNMAVASDDVLVPPKSTVVLSYVPKSSTEK